MAHCLRSTAFAAGCMSVVLAIAVAHAQTRVDMGSQARNIDFSQAGSTRPFAVGTSMPAVCRIGETFFRVDTVAGRNLYLCTATNIWTNVNGVAASTNTQAVDAGKLLGTNGAATGWRAMPGFTDNGSRIVPDGTILGALAGNNIWTGHQIYPASATQVLAATTDRIRCDRRTVAVSATAPLTLASAATILDGFDGQVCVIVNVGPSNITVQDQDTLLASNLQLNANRVTIPPKGRVTLEYSSTVGDWILDGASSAPSTAGLQDISGAQTGPGALAARTITGTNGVIVTNGNGVAGDPDISMPGSNKGDLVVHDGTENTRFASGANGDLLIADSAQPTGLRWGPRRVGVSNGLSVANADWSAGDTATIALPGAAKGDLIVHNGSTNVRQPAGVDGQSIVYDSTQSAGIRADGLQHPNFAPANTSADNLPSSAVLMDAATGAILYGRDAKLGNWAASTTKTVSALLLAEYDTALDDTVTIEATDISSVPPGSSLCNVSAGQIYTTAELLKGILTPSGNDCTQAVARHVGNTYLGGGGTPIGGRTAFVARMNTRMAELAAELGTTRTSAFTNAYAGVVGTAITSSSSLDGHYISAYDLALTMRKIVLTQPTVLAQMAKGSDRMCTTTGSCIEHKGTSGNTSNVLCWAGALGAKGGSWTSPTFVSHMGAYERGTQKYIITLMNYPNTNQRSSDMLSLVEWAFRTNTTPATASCEEANSTIVTAGGFMDSSYNPTYSGGYSKFSNTLNDTIRIRWYGSQVQVYTVNRSANGNAAFRTDGDPETLVDTYRSVTAGNQLSYTSPLLPVGWHYTDMRVATATSGGTGAQLDRYVVTR